MKPYVVLLRGINVGGRNKISMAALKEFLEELGFSDVVTYIQSGNIILKSTLTPNAIRQIIEEKVSVKFSLDSETIKTLVLSKEKLQHVVDTKPHEFGDHPDTYNSDVIFLIDIPVLEAIKVFKIQEGVDTICPGNDVIYSQRLSSMRTKSKLNRIIGTKAYKSMTIRNWNTTLKLLEIVNKF